MRERIWLGAGLALVVAVGCAGAEDRAVVCDVASQAAPPLPHGTGCGETDVAYDAKRGCAIDPAGREQIYFVNRIREWTQTVKVTVLVDGEEVFASSDPVLLERDTFPIATLGGGDYEIETVIETWGRSGPLCDARHEARSVHRRGDGEGPLTVVLYSMKERPLEDSISVRWEEPGASLSR